MSSTSAFRFVPRLESFEERVNASTMSLQPTVDSSPSDAGKMVNVYTIILTNATGPSLTSQTKPVPAGDFLLTLDPVKGESR